MKAQPWLLWVAWLDEPLLQRKQRGKDWGLQGCVSFSLTPELLLLLSQTELLSPSVMFLLFIVE